MLIGTMAGLALLLGPTAVQAGDKAKKPAKVKGTGRAIVVGGLLQDLSLIDGGNGTLIDGGKEGVLNGFLSGGLNDLLANLLGSGVGGLGS